MLLYSVLNKYVCVFQGRIHQIEYAMEAVKQGSATVGLKSKTHAVLVALKVQIIRLLLIVLFPFIMYSYLTFDLPVDV